MLLVVPTAAAPGVPHNCPVALSNAAHAGRFVIVYVSVSPSGSLVVGVNEYAVFCSTDVAGAPEIVGGEFVGGGPGGDGFGGGDSGGVGFGGGVLGGGDSGGGVPPGCDVPTLVQPLPVHLHHGPPVPLST
jgi:hypothetical protein